MPIFSMPNFVFSQEKNYVLHILLVTLLISAALIASVMWQIVQGLESMQSQQRHLRQLLNASYDIRHADGSLTNTARLIILTEDMKWKAKHEEMVVVIKNGLETANRLAPEVMKDLTETIESTNDRRLELEASSLLLLQKGYKDAAIDILTGKEYLLYKENLSMALEQLNANVQKTITLIDANTHQQVHIRMFVAGTSLCVILGIWLMALRMLHTWRRNILKETSQRREAEAKIEEQSRFLDNIINNLPVGLFTKNVKRNYEWSIWNKKAEQLFGLKAAEVIGTSDFNHFPHAEASFFREMDIKAMKEGHVIDIEEEPVTTKGRGTWLAHTIKVPIYDQNGQPETLLGIIEDITVRKQQANAKLQNYAEELEQKNVELEKARSIAETADRSKTEFLATMSHEIRTPLNGVIGSTDLLSRTPLSPQQADYASTIRKSGETLLYIINDILDLTKLEARQLGLEKLPFDFSRTIEDVVDINSANAGKKNLDILLRYAPGTPERIIADPGRLRQILNNLISNAIKFTNTGHILVNVETAEPLNPSGEATLRVSITDTGVGIAPEHHDRIFQRFVQAEASTTRKFGGSGLGLAICKQLVELMGGQIGLTSTMGQGSTFWFTLPTMVDQNAVAPLQTEDLTGKRVVVVDDNPTNLNILKEMLHFWQCEVQCFESGNDILTWLQQYSGTQNPFDIAILDHDMPEMDGPTLCENLRLHPLTAEIPMLVFSSRAMRGDTAFLAEKGFNGFLTKPSRPEELRFMLSALFHPLPEGQILTRHYINEHTKVSAEIDLKTSFSFNVLVVEDEPVNQKVIRLMLEELGCTVDVATSGKTGIQAFQQSEYDIVFMDMQMPEMDGPEATIAIREWEQSNNRPRTTIVALTANALAEHRDRCLKAGMDDYMTKPIDHNKLVALLSQFSGKPAPLLSAAPPVLTEDQQAELNQAFHNSAQELLQHLEQAEAFEDTEAWQRAAHRFKGAAASFGHVALSTACEQAEAAPTPSAQLLQHIRQAYTNIS